MKVIGTIEARMGSSRMPGKTLMPVYKDRPLLELIITRFKRSQETEKIVVATTVELQDDPIAAWCAENHIAFYRGSENNVLDRVVQAATAHQADAIIQMGADSAYLDVNLIDELVALFKSGRYDYVCNDFRPTYPLGIYAHIVSLEILKGLNNQKTLSKEDREDVVRPIFEHPHRYRVMNVSAPEHMRCPDLRLTVDYPEDMALAKRIYAYFDRDNFSTADLILLHHNHPEFFQETKDLVQHSVASTRGSDRHTYDEVTGRSLG